MILNNDIMTIIIHECNLDSRLLYKIGSLNKEHKSYVEDHYTDVFMKNILPNLNLMKYLDRYYTCTKCFKIKQYVGHRLGICEDCFNTVDQCEKCGDYRDCKDLVDHPYRGTYCREYCHYVCIKCDNCFHDSKEVERLSGYNFICYPCYFQEDAIENYKKRKAELQK